MMFTYRNWNLDNTMVMPTMTLTNNMMPDANIFYGAVNHKFTFGKITLLGKAGVSYQKINEGQRLDFYKTLYADAENSRWFPVFGLSANYSTMLNEDWGAGALIETGNGSTRN